MVKGQLTPPECWKGVTWTRRRRDEFLALDTANMGRAVRRVFTEEMCSRSCSRCSRNSRSRFNKTCNRRSNNFDNKDWRLFLAAESRQEHNGINITAPWTVNTKAKKITWYSVIVTKVVGMRKKDGSITGALALRSTSSPCSTRLTISFALDVGFSKALPLLIGETPFRSLKDA